MPIRITPSALLRDHTDRLMALLPYGNHFVSRLLASPISFRLDRQRLTLSSGEYMLGEVTLDLGGEAAAWANKIENIGGYAVPDLPEPIAYAVRPSS